jgi:hypothetical protein
MVNGGALSSFISTIIAINKVLHWKLFSYQIEFFLIQFSSDVTTDEISPLGIFFEKEIETRSRFQVGIRVSHFLAENSFYVGQNRDSSQSKQTGEGIDNQCEEEPQSRRVWSTKSTPAAGTCCMSGAKRGEAFVPILNNAKTILHLKNTPGMLYKQTNRIFCSIPDTGKSVHVKQVKIKRAHRKES